MSALLVTALSSHNPMRIELQEATRSFERATAAALTTASTSHEHALAALEARHADEIAALTAQAVTQQAHIEEARRKANAAETRRRREAEGFGRDVAALRTALHRLEAQWALLGGLVADAAVSEVVAEHEAAAVAVTALAEERAAAAAAAMKRAAAGLSSSSVRKASNGLDQRDRAPPSNRITARLRPPSAAVSRRTGQPPDHPVIFRRVRSSGYGQPGIPQGVVSPEEINLGVSSSQKRRGNLSERRHSIATTASDDDVDREGAVDARYFNNDDGLGRDDAPEAPHQNHAGTDSHNPHSEIAVTQIASVKDDAKPVFGNAVDATQPRGQEDTSINELAEASADRSHVYSGNGKQVVIHSTDRSQDAQQSSRLQADITTLRGCIAVLDVELRRHVEMQALRSSAPTQE